MLDDLIQKKVGCRKIDRSISIVSIFFLIVAKKCVVYLCIIKKRNVVDTD